MTRDFVCQGLDYCVEMHPHHEHFLRVFPFRTAKCGETVIVDIPRLTKRLSKWAGREVAFVTTQAVGDSLYFYFYEVS